MTLTMFLYFEFMLWNSLNRGSAESCDHPEWDHDATLYTLLVLIIIQLLVLPCEIYNNVAWITGESTHTDVRVFALGVCEPVCNHVGMRVWFAKTFVQADQWHRPSVLHAHQCCRRVQGVARG